jgi:hypothetical protein
MRVSVVCCSSPGLFWFRVADASPASARLHSERIFCSNETLVDLAHVAEGRSSHRVAHTYFLILIPIFAVCLY